MKNTKKKIDELDLDPSLFEDILSDVPKEIPTLQLPDRFLREYYRNETYRILWIDDAIDDSSLYITNKIFYYNRVDKDIPVEKRKPIKIFINTTGGAVHIMWSIIRAIEISKTPVWTVNWSSALSAGGQILAAGHKRFAMPGSTVLIHSGSCTYSGTAEQAESAKKYYDALIKKADDFLLSKTKIDQKTMKKKAPFDWYLSDEEALQYGIVDKIIDNFEEIM